MKQPVCAAAPTLPGRRLTSGQRLTIAVLLVIDLILGAFALGGAVRSVRIEWATPPHSSSGGAR